MIGVDRVLRVVRASRGPSADRHLRLQLLEPVLDQVDVRDHWWGRRPRGLDHVEPLPGRRGVVTPRGSAGEHHTLGDGRNSRYPSAAVFSAVSITIILRRWPPPVGRAKPCCHGHAHTARLTAAPLN